MFNSPITVLVGLTLCFFYPNQLSIDGLYDYMGDMVRQSDENAPPKVEIMSPEHYEVVSWGSQVRYSIRVSDAEDGDSRFGEINPAEVFLELEFIPDREVDNAIEKETILSKNAALEPAGLTLIRNSTCFGCHRDKSKMTGPSFSEIARRYETSKTDIGNLATSIIGGSSGKWSNVEMPPNDNLSKEEAEEIAAYILEQGRNKQQWIYPGLEGVIRIGEDLADMSDGLFKLRASYLDHGMEGERDEDSRKLGAHTIMLRIE